MVASGRVKRIALSYIVPGHTKFQPDTMFSQIENLFYITYTFETRDLIQVIGACNVIPHELSLHDLLRWRQSLMGRYVEIPNVSEWNLLVIERVTERQGDRATTVDISLKVKRSVMDLNYANDFRAGSSELRLLRIGEDIKKDLILCKESPAALDFSMRKHFKRAKLQNITECTHCTFPAIVGHASLKILLIRRLISLRWIQLLIWTILMYHLMQSLTHKLLELVRFSVLECPRILRLSVKS